MASWRIWLLPALLAAAQIALWPGVPLARGEAVDPTVATAVLAITVGLAAALLARRRAPVAVAVAVAAGIGLAGWVAPGQAFLTPGDATAVASIADQVALFSVAALRSRRTTALVLAGLLLWQAGSTALRDGVTADYPLDLVLDAAVYAIVAAAGRVRRRWVADRAAAAHQLARAEQTRREAAGAERHRLARELHDVTAHHLTSIVVNASAAQFLAGRRPELHAEALDFAARTGREALADLRRLVAVLPAAEETGDPRPPELADLADDFRRLGQVITVEATGDPPPAAAQALHAIAREALTNTLRYAPGSRVALVQAYGPDGALLVVEDDGGAGASPAAGLGGGRGLAGLRERAAALGGTVEAGPRAEGGWRVRALLPPPAAVRRRAGHRPVGAAVLDAGVALLTLVLPLAVAAVAADEGVAPAALALVLLAAVAQSAPLLWRRGHPWAVLAAVTLATWLGPVLVATGVAPSGDLFVFGVGAGLAAVYAVAARGARSWLAPLVAPASTALAFGLMVTVEPPIGEQLHRGLTAAGLLLFSAAFVAVVLAVPFAGAWLAGHLVRRRRERRRDRERGPIAVEGMRAEARARNERARVADGLRATVLEHAARVPRAAEQADLPGVLDAARDALAAMRGLLDGLGARPHPSEDGLGAHPHPSEDSPGAHPHPSEDSPGAHPHPSEDGPGAHPHPSEDGPGGRPHPSEKESSSSPSA